MALKRLKRELRVLHKEQSSGNLSDVHVFPSEDQFSWDCCFAGPEDTPFEGGWFWYTLIFPADFPFKPPEVKQETPIYHPELNRPCSYCGFNDGMLKKWKPVMYVKHIFKYIEEQLRCPHGKRCVNTVWDVYDNDYATYCLIAKEWTREYANKPPLSLLPAPPSAKTDNAEGLEA